MVSNFSTGEYNLEVDEDDIENRVLLHLDIDYFFAQVEILKQPDLKDKPVIVGHTDARKTRRGVVLTCSYEARKFGVHSGQPMNTALELCPDAVIVKSSYSDYREISDHIMAILKKLDVPMRQAGIDEAYVDITTLVTNYKMAKELALELKREILQQVQLTVSVGIGPTLKIAKICSDYNKPDGITVVPPDQLSALFENLPLIDIPGIGDKTAQSLKKKGFKTCDQLFPLSKLELIQLLGSMGEYYYDILHGKSTNRIKPRGMRKSISHSRTFIAKPGEIDKCREYFNKLFDKSYQRLTEGEFETKTVGLRIRFNDFDTITRAQSIPYHTNNKDRLFDIAKQLIKPYLQDSRGIRLIGVGFYNLRQIEGKQVSLDNFLDQTKKKSNPHYSASSSSNKQKQLDLDDFFS